MNSNRATLLLRLFLAFIATYTAAACSSAEESPLDAVAPLIGQWHIDTKWLNSDKPLKARVVFEWGPGKKFVISHTFIADKDGSEYERYHEVIGVVDGKLIDHLFDFEGKTHTRELHKEGNVLKSDWDVEKAAEPTSIHQELELAGDENLKWRISITRGGKTEQIMDGIWIKDGSK